MKAPKPVLHEMLSDDRLLARAGQRIRSWKLGTALHDGVCFLCDSALPAGNSTWREAMKNPSAAHGEARICTVCWPAVGPNPIMVKMRGHSLVEMWVSGKKDLPGNSLLVGKHNAYALLRELKAVLDAQLIE